MDDFDVSNPTPLATRFTNYRDPILKDKLIQAEGRITRLTGLVLEAREFTAPIGSRCLVRGESGQMFGTEVIGFNEEKTYLMPMEPMQNVALGAFVMCTGKISEVSVSSQLIGRVIDGNGHVLDQLGPIDYAHRVPLNNPAMNPLLHAMADTPLDVGIRAINACITVGKGQRFSIFCPKQSGKSTLLGMLARFVNAQKIVIGLIGLSSLEIKEFIEKNLGQDGLRKSVVIASAQEDLPLVKVHAAMRATSIAEYFRDQGEDVVLIMDSLTQVAKAEQEIALAVGERQAIQDYPSSVFSKISHLVSRAGNTILSSGTLTAFYTLSQEKTDPVNIAIDSYLDGTITLSESLARSGCYPAIDLEKSRSHVMNIYAEKNQKECVEKIKKLVSSSKENVGKERETLTLDSEVLSFLQQDQKTIANYEQSLKGLKTLIAHRK